ncbi:hypothetical protein B0H14DRAFT_2694453 [Mycena olivaceomarginata]|nr:hypothetical protein B0H14DRAFT_2694453 [Mycena olivaceomarginata]
MASFPPIPPDVGQRYLFGMFFNYGLMGSLVVQVYRYYQAFPQDRMSTKAIVYALFVLELAQTGIMTYFAYTVFGAGYGNLDVFDRSALEWFPVCILGSIIAGIVQLFYAYRVRAFSGSWIAGGLVTFLALVQIASGIAQGVISKQLEDRSRLTGKPIAVTIWLVSSAVCDILIAGFMTYYVRFHSQHAVVTHVYYVCIYALSSNAGHIRSSQMKNYIAKIVRYTVETGAITALVASLMVIVQHAFPENNYFETPSWVLGKLYSNNLLVLLNARAVTVGGRDYVHSTDTRLDDRRASDVPSGNASDAEHGKAPRRYPSSRTLELDDIRV